MGLSPVYTGDTMILMVRDQIGDPEGSGSPRWKTPELLRNINRGLLRIASDTETLIETIWETPLELNKKDYDFPGNIVSDKLVEYQHANDDRRIMTYLTLEQWASKVMSNPTNTGIPQWYTHWRRLGSDDTVFQPSTLEIYPIPDSTVDTKTLRMRGYKLPDEVLAASLDRAMELEPQYCEAAVLWAAGLCKGSDRESGEAARLMSEYRVMKGEIIGKKARRSRSKRPRITGLRTGSLFGNWIPPWKPAGSDQVFW